MTHSQRSPGLPGDREQTKIASRRAAIPPVEGKQKKSLSMHEGVAVWCDCCSCEAEPYWVAVAEEMGIDLGGDYAEESVGSPSEK